MDPMDPMMGGGGLTPEQLQMLMEYGANQGAFTEQDRAIQQQLAQAHALRNRRPVAHTTGIGGGLGAVGDFLGDIAGARKENTARENDKLLQLQMVAGLRKLAAQNKPQPLPGYDPASDSLADPMGGGGAYIMPGSLYR